MLLIVLRSMLFSASLHTLVMWYYDTPTSEFAFDELIWIESGSNPPPDVDQVDRDRFDVDSSVDRIDVRRSDPDPMWIRVQVRTGLKFCYHNTSWILHDTSCHGHYCGFCLLPSFSTAYKYHNQLNVELAFACPTHFLLIHLVATPINYTSTCHV